MPLGFRHAGGRLVEQQHARPAGDRERDLEQALLAVGQGRGALVHHVGEMEALEDLDDSSITSPFDADQAPPLAAEPMRSETASPMVSSGVRSANS